MGEMGPSRLVRLKYSRRLGTFLEVPEALIRFKAGDLTLASASPCPSDIDMHLLSIPLLLPLEQAHGHVDTGHQLYSRKHSRCIPS